MVLTIEFLDLVLMSLWTWDSGMKMALTPGAFMIRTQEILLELYDTECRGNQTPDHFPTIFSAVFTDIERKTEV